MKRFLHLGGETPTAGELRRIRRARCLTWEEGLPPDALFFARPEARVVPPGEEGPDALSLLAGTGRSTTPGPLGGGRVVLTRQPQNLAGISRAVRAAGGRPIPFPVFETRPLPTEGVLAALSRRAWRIVGVTSPVGAHCLGRLAEDLRRPLPPLAAVGPGTRRALLSHGLPVEITSRRATGSGLAESLREHVRSGDAVLLLRSAEASRELPGALAEMGCIVEDVPLYEAFDLAPGTREALGELMGAGAVDWLTFFSGGSARRFAALFPRGEWRRVPTAVVGPVTARQADQLGFAVQAVAARPSPSALIQAMVQKGRRS